MDVRVGFIKMLTATRGELAKRDLDTKRDCGVKLMFIRQNALVHIKKKLINCPQPFA